MTPSPNRPRRPSPSPEPGDKPRHAPAGSGSPPPPTQLHGRSQSQSPGEGEEPSQSSSAGSSAASFVADAGPDFDPRRAPEAPKVEEPELPVEEWDEQRIRELLTIQGQVTHAALRVGAQDTETWVHTARDLDTIAPPLTRILNRYDITRAAAAAGDEILLVTAVTRYGLTNWTRRRRLLAAQEDEGPRPVTGVEAPPESGPETDEEYERVNDPMFMAPPDITPKGGRR
jgi:hypothetical protein